MVKYLPNTQKAQFQTPAMEKKKLPKFTIHLHYNIIFLSPFFKSPNCMEFNLKEDQIIRTKKGVRE